MRFKIILVINKDQQKVCEQYCNKEIDLDKSVIEEGRELFIVYKDGGYFTHETVESIENFEKYGLRISTSKKVWFIH